MKRLFRGRLEIEELEPRTPPSVILGFFLPAIEIAAIPASDAPDGADSSTDGSLTVASEIFDSPAEIPVGFETLDLSFHLEGVSAYDSPDGLDFAPSLSSGIPSDLLEVASIPLLSDAAEIAAVTPAEAQVEVIPLPKVSLTE